MPAAYGRCGARITCQMALNAAASATAGAGGANACCAHHAPATNAVTATAALARDRGVTATRIAVPNPHTNQRARVCRLKGIDESYRPVWNGRL